MEFVYCGGQILQSLNLGAIDVSHDTNVHKIKPPLWIDRDEHKEATRALRQENSFVRW